MNAIRSGPTVAPVSSSAVLTAYTHPWPCRPVEYDSMASTVGLRIARPVRSASTSAPASCQLPASAMAGTASVLIAYPMNVTGQCLPVLSATYPETERRLYPRNSPAPAMMLIAAALAPSEPRNGPLMLAPPSYVTSPNRLTMPIVTTNRNAGEDENAMSRFFTAFTGAPAL